jgi:hypothetical protein
MKGHVWAASKRIWGRIEIAGLCVLLALTLAMMIRDHLPASTYDLAHFAQSASKSMRADAEYRAWRDENPHPNKRELRAAKRAILREM